MTRSHATPSTRPRLSSDHRDSVLMESLGAHAARIGMVGYESTESWLSGICERFHASFDRRARCTAALFLQEPSTEAFSLAALDCSEGYGASYEGFLDERLTSGTTEGLFLGTPGFDSIGNTPTVRLRTDLLTDTRWRNSPLFGERTRRSLHDFAWMCVRPDAAQPGAVLVVELDGARLDWRPDEDVRFSLRVLGAATRAAYVHGPHRLSERRERLLGKLSELRQKIARRIALGESEAQIAERFDRSRHTIRDHTRAIYKSWDVSTRTELRELWLGRREPSDSIVR
ncbi:unnamed protein product [Symbiodinium necroappetens]|uniref:HTH luxR-type domain-containing protein n=1 Tax=Symbiodinium necroappetens TaxID=1628268 RepID=A0A812MAL3_9DINO|nr:unnamed protein product [Symbiodinium necroappetens]